MMKNSCITMLIAIILALSCNGQNTIQLRNGSRINAQQIISMRGDLIAYKQAGTEFDINKSEVAYVLHSELGRIDVNKDEAVAIDTLNLSNFKGFLLDKGNNVYIPLDSPNSFERSGAEELKRLIEQDSVWNVVEHPQEAHFLLEYCVSLKGFDRAYVLISNREKNNVLNSNDLRYVLYNDIVWFTDESIEKNIDVASKIHKKYIKEIYNVVLKNPIKIKPLESKLNIFIIE